MSSTIAIGHVTEKNHISFNNRSEATSAWLGLATMGVPSALWSGADGWLPNTKTTAWEKHDGLVDYSLVPDLMITKTPVGLQISSLAMQCECAASESNVWKVVSEIVSEYRERMESDCWEVA